jgi:polar amino acid transport system substrate-binding protein
MTGKITTKRVGQLALLVLLVLMLAGCGADTATAVPAATDTPAGVAATDTPVALAPTDTVEAAVTPTEMAAETATEGTSGAAPPAGATPVSDWKPGAHAQSIPPPAKLVTAGTLTVGSDAGYPPQEYIDASGKAVGMDIDIAEEIASRLGLTLKVVNFKFDDIIPALSAGQFDMVISAMTITDERKKVVDFVPYFDAGQAVLVAKGNPKGIKTLDDLSGKTAVAEQGTTEEQTLKDLNDKLTAAGKPKVNVLTYPSDTDAVDQLRVGRADATLHDSPVAAYYAKINPAFEVAIADFDSAPEGIATAQNNKAMGDAVNAAITAMKSDGSLDAIKAKWGVK